jgi:4-amino-4-deoxy-L-arabinose transferase-like glycosyltransferase
VRRYRRDPLTAVLTRTRARPRLPTALLVGAILLIALAARVAYIEHTSYKAVNDAGTYNRLASMIARTGDYDTGSAPGSGTGGSKGPTAYFPPGFPYFLGLVDIIDGHQAGQKPAISGGRLSQAVLGTAAVALIGLVALEALGAAEALAALVLAAVYPVLIELSGTLVAENLLIVLMLGAIWTTLRALRSERPFVWIFVTGVLTGLATLTHQNAILLVIPLGYAIWSSVRRRPDRSRAGVATLAAPTIFIIITGLTIAPWTIRNAVELHHFIPVSDETGMTLEGTYNPESAVASVPYKWRYYFQIPQDAQLRKHAGRYEEVAFEDQLQSRALHYIDAHPLSPLAAAWHNTVRMFELEGSYAWHASALAIGLHPKVARTGVVAFWLVCLLALAGVFTRAARAAPKWLWTIPVLFALSVVLINVETPRFREPIDPFLVMLAGCAVAAAVRAAAQRANRRGHPLGSGHGERCPGAELRQGL